MSVIALKAWSHAWSSHDRDGKAALMYQSQLQLMADGGEGQRRKRRKRAFTSKVARQG